MKAGGWNAARNKVVGQTKLCNRPGVPKLLLRLGEEIFEHVHHLPRSCTGSNISSPSCSSSLGTPDHLGSFVWPTTVSRAASPPLACQPRNSGHPNYRKMLCYFIFCVVNRGLRHVNLGVQVCSTAVKASLFLKYFFLDRKNTYEQVTF